MAEVGVTHTGLPFCVRFSLPGPQPTTASVVRLSDGTMEKPQSWTLLELGLAPTVTMPKKSAPFELTNLAPEFCGIWYWVTPLAATEKLAFPTDVVTLMVRAEAFGL
ncbi:hypothetical protein BGE01nite_10090 [Brevifollis gellanilyticus]|uniref:Uncharacterized protein n=1 Tax=Brevifollis gellanilyticus TaxID=748831 RepID=A0A512M4R2_9BACT|nr:hypothetical protein BGE01nite_10090 [Brevifollis gellanilyticus]